MVASPLPVVSVPAVPPKVPVKVPLRAGVVTATLVGPVRSFVLTVPPELVAELPATSLAVTEKVYDVAAKVALVVKEPE